MATGKWAFGMCDRCGRKYALHTLKKEWTGLKVCPPCFEVKHPQLEPKRESGDNIAVPEARPDHDDDGDYTDFDQLSEVITMHFGNTGMP